jgi:carboxyl-terminal processing protease
MKNRLLWLLLVVTITAQAAAPDSTPTAPTLAPVASQPRAAHLAAELLTRYHYKAMPLDDAMSAKIFDRYLKALDGEKYFFVQADIDQMDAARNRLDDAILGENLDLPFAIFNLYAQRAVERFGYARSLLKEGFDFRKADSLQIDRAKEPWPKTENEARELWRLRVKNDWLRLKLAGKDDKSIVETLDKRYDNFIRRIGRTKSEDAFQIFMNAYTMSVEPHSNYMGSRTAEDFDISMRLSLVGIGASLTEKDDYTVVRELIAGGPAILSGQLKAGDRIVGVAQGEKGTMTDVVGWRLDDVVAQIRGAADSVVVLDILPADAGPDGKHKLVTLTRKKITLEQQAAKKSIISVAEGKTKRRIGVISLPTFYEDFAARAKGDPNFKSATKDVVRLLDELKAEKVDGVLIDLRDNGGGSLTEAVELSGLFIGKGPVVQQRDAQGNITVAKDDKAAVAWNGPLGVLINRGSASASEIFAAAIQDYGRGLLIGERSFGKGTVQTMVNLDQIAKNQSPAFGELKLTIAQFFRINGGTTQLRGVKPEIIFPSFADEDNFGESSYDNALPWVKIKPVDYAEQGDIKPLLPSLQTRHENRVKSAPGFQALNEDVAEVLRLRKKNVVSLNEAERRKERDAQEAKQAAREKLLAAAGVDAAGTDKESEAAKKLARQDDGLQASERNISSELAAEKRRKDAKDILLDEAARVLGDEIGLLQSSRIATRNKRGAAPLAGQSPRTARVEAAAAN